MVELVLAPDLFTLAKKGRKKATIRRGRREVPLGEALLCSELGVTRVIVERVRHCRLGELTDADAVRDGFATLSELQAALARFYNHLEPDETVTVIEFDLISTSL